MILLSIASSFTYLGLMGAAVAAAFESPYEASHVRRASLRRDFIGYRRVDKDTAKVYNETGLEFNGNTEPTQIGEGIYVSLARETLKANNDDDWWCEVYAGKTFRKVPKIWIPERGDHGEELWWQEDDTRITQYIEGVNYYWDPKKTVRLSVIDGNKNQTEAVQMTIPAAIVAYDFDWKVFCWDSGIYVGTHPVEFIHLGKLKGTKKEKKIEEKVKEY